MTDQTIPAEKVRELAEKYDGDMPTDPQFLLGEIKADLRALLPTPPQPITGLLGRWAKHPEHGDVVCVAERPASGLVKIAFKDNFVLMSVGYATVTLDSLTFPHQATHPDDVPAGEAWLVDVNAGELSLKSALAIKDSNDTWLTLEGATRVTLCSNGMITLLAPLTPERPGKDDEGFLAENERILAAYSECAEALQARYDELDKSWCYLDGKYSTLREDYDALEAKYREAQEKIKTLEQPAPVWRIEHDWRNIRVGEYIIDIDDDTGTVTRLDVRGHRDTDGDTYASPCFAPFIVFPNKAAATPEAIEEAKRARDKEMKK